LRQTSGVFIAKIYFFPGTEINNPLKPQTLAIVVQPVFQLEDTQPRGNDVILGIAIQGEKPFA
jgi:hypothetical protein